MQPLKKGAIFKVDSGNSTGSLMGGSKRRKAKTVDQFLISILSMGHQIKIGGLHWRRIKAGGENTAEEKVVSRGSQSANAVK